jgi:hypothetical protein
MTRYHLAGLFFGLALGLAAFQFGMRYPTSTLPPTPQHEHVLP